MGSARIDRKLRHRRLGAASRRQDALARRTCGKYAALNASAATQLVSNLLIAAILGGAIGAQRQAARKPAGFRTHVLVALGSCAFMEASRLTGDDRLAANIVTGIGFLGAGAIVRDGAQARGLTTAASIWVAAAAGTAVGISSLPAYLLAAAAVGLTLLALGFSDAALDRVLPETREADCSITFAARLSLDDVERLFADRSLHVHLSDQLRVARVGDEARATWSLRVSERHRHRLRNAVLEIGRADGIYAIEINPRRA